MFNWGDSPREKLIGLLLALHIAFAVLLALFQWFFT